MVFDAAGPGVGGTSASSRSFSATIAADATGVVVIGSLLANAAPTITAQVGATSMTQLSGSPFNITGFLYLFAFGLTGAIPTGTQTIQVSYSGGTAWLSAFDSLSYKNVHSFGTPVTAKSTGVSASISVTSAANQRVAVGMTSDGSTVGSGFTSLSGFTSSYSVGTATSGNRATVIGETAGAATVSMSATASSGTSNWGAIAVPLVP